MLQSSHVSHLLVVLFTIIIATLCLSTVTTHPSVSLFVSAADEPSPSFPLWTHNANNTLNNVFGLNSDLNDNSSIRIVSRFKFVGIGIFTSPAGKSFTDESFHDRVLAALPDSWKPSREIFRQNLVILEYCSWQFTTTQFAKPCAKLTRSDWKSFLAEVINTPACMNRDTSNGFQVVPYNSSIRETLVRFTFDGADREEYFENFFIENGQNANPMGLCQLDGCTEFGNGDGCYLGNAKEANILDNAVVPQSAKFPSHIRQELDRIARIIQQNPADSGAIVAIIVLIVIFLLAYCLYSCLTKKQPTKEEAAAAAAAESANAVAGGANNTGGDDNTTTTTTNHQQRPAAAASRQDNYRVSMNNNNNNNAPRPSVEAAGDDDDDDEMTRAIAAARKKKRQIQPVEDSSQEMKRIAPEDNNNGISSNFGVRNASNNNNGDDSNDNNDDSPHHRRNTSSSNKQLSSMKKMGLGSELFGLPRDGDQPAILSAPAIHEGRDTSVLDNNHDHNHHHDQAASSSSRGSSPSSPPPRNSGNKTPPPPPKKPSIDDIFS